MVVVLTIRMKITVIIGTNQVLLDFFGCSAGDQKAFQRMTRYKQVV